MENRSGQQPWEDLRDLAAVSDMAGLTNYIESLSSSEALRAIFHLSSEDRQRAGSASFEMGPQVPELRRHRR